MTTLDFVIDLFVRVDDAMKNVRKHSQAKLYPSELVTLGLLYALKGDVGPGMTACWWKPLFPCSLTFAISRSWRIAPGIIWKHASLL